MKKFNQLIKNYKKSPNLIYYLLENKTILIGFVAVFSFIVRFSVAIVKNNFFDSLFIGFEFSSVIVVTVVAILLYFKDYINLKLIKKISKTKHSVIFGLGKFSTSLLENELKNNKTSYILFDKIILDDQVEHFRHAGMGVVVTDVFSQTSLENLNFKTMSYAVITLGNDRLNIELATKIIDHYIKKQIKTPIKLIVHIVNRDLNTLFHQQFIAPTSDCNAKIDIQTFSFYEECAVRFFEQYAIDGSSDTYMQSNKPFNIVIAGNGELALNMVYQAALLAQLPNENKLTIHLVDKEASQFKQYIIKYFTYIEKVVELKTCQLDHKTIDYYNQDDLWKQKDLTHVIICYDNEETNLQIMTDLFNKTYIEIAVVDQEEDKDITKSILKSQISCAIFNAYTISNKINDNKESFGQFYTFGDVSEICTCKNILEDEHDLIAKLIHKGYAQEYQPNDLYNLSDELDLAAIDKEWYDTTRLSDRLSNKVQSKFIDTKLKAMQLTRVDSKKKKSTKDLLQLNRALFDKILSSDRVALGLDEAFLENYSKQLPKLWDTELRQEEPIDILYFPKKFDTLFEKLVRMEHNRWNAFHYLNGWEFNKVKTKPKKQHDCLIPLSDFNTPEIQLTVLYDINSVLYIPNFLANAGWEIVKL